MNKDFTTWLYWLLPILAVALIAPWSSDIDLAISRYFYTQGEFFAETPFLFFIYNYGTIPAWIMAAIGAFLIFTSTTRIAGIYLLLTLAIGAGVITHAILKDHWGRPRPRQVVEFGGNQPFRAFYDPHFAKEKTYISKSFPCGHCTMGFYFFALFFLGVHYRKKWMFFSGLCLAFFLGGILGYARMAQGGHFFSDVLLAALIMWLTALVLYRTLLLHRKTGNN